MAGEKTIPLVFAPLISDLPVIILVLLILTNVPMKFCRYFNALVECFSFTLAFKLTKHGAHSIAM